MSISIASGVDAPLALSGFFAADAEEPITFCGFVKVAGASTGFSSRFLFDAKSSGGDGYEIRAYTDGSTLGLRQTIVSFGVGDNNTEILTASELDYWIPVVAVYSAIDSRMLYTKLANGTVIANPDSDTRSTSGDVLDLTLLPIAFTGGESKAAYLTIYQSALTQAQAEEFMSTGEVAALTPLAKWDATSDWGAGTITDSGSSGTNLTPPAGWTFSTDNPSVSTGGLSLSTIPATAFPGQSRTVTGTGFGATQGTGGWTIGGVSQTITAWSDTSFTFITVLGTNSYGAGKTGELTTDGGQTVSDTIELVADTANGFGYVDMSSPNTTDESSVAFNTTPTVVTGDQFEWEDFNNLGNLTVDAQGFVTNVDTEGTFRGRFWDATDSTWGAVETFNATIPESAPAFAPDVGIISKTDTTGTIPFSYIGGDADSFEHSTDGGSTWNTVTSPISRTGLTAETTYSGLIRAVNTGGSGPTASYSFTTNAVGVVDDWPFGKGINPTATKNWEWGKRHPKTGMRVRIYK